MSYLGRGSNLTRKAQDKVSFLATAGQTVRTGLSYVPTHVDVTVNGITLTEITDYTATNGNSITFSVALALNDEVTIVSSKTFDVANHYTISAANALLAAKATNTAVALKSPIASPVFTGNVGVGATPASWASPAKALQVGSTASLAEWNNGSSIISIVGSNSYFNSGYKYSTTNTAAMIRLSNGSMDFRVAASGSAGAAITFNTGLEVLASGKARAKNGLLFGTDSAVANVLDDYEEGTFTPSGTGVNTSSSVGAYTKIGRVCHVQIWIEANGNTAGHLGGLPFVSGIGGANFLGVGSVGFQNGTVHSIMTTGNTGGWYMYASNNSAGQLTNGQQLHCSLTYLTV